MNNKYFYIILTICILCQTVAYLNASEDTGTTGFSFLKVPFSARAAAMGNSFTALSDHTDGVFFNPAGLVQSSEKQISSTYINYFEGFHGGSLVYAFPAKDIYHLAVFTQYLGTASIEKTIVDEQGIFFGTAGTFGANNIIFGLSVSRYVNELLNIGFSGKFIREQLDDHSATAIAADLAILHHTTNERLILGVVLKNMGTQLTYHTESQHKEKLPSTVSVGFRYFPRDDLNITLDVNKPFVDDFAVTTGMEFEVHPMLQLRGGYNLNAKDWKAGGSLDFLSGISLGFGINLEKYNIDYAVSSYGDLGFINQITLKHSF